MNLTGNMQFGGHWAIVQVLTCWAVLLWNPAADSAESSAMAKPPAGLPAEEVFDPHRLWQAHLRVTAGAWKRMQMNRAGEPMRVSAPAGGALAGPVASPAEPATRPAAPVAKGDYEVLPAGYYGHQFTYVRGTLEFNGQVFNDVAIRFKGASSYDTMTQSLKRPFKIDFDRFVDGQLFHGLQQINLQNNACDPSQIRDALSYWAFRQAGIPSPRSTFVLLYLTIEGEQDRTCLGVYTLVEEVDRRFLNWRFDSSAGLLLKPETGKLPYLGDDWSQYRRGYQPHTKGSENEIRRIIELARVIHQETGQAFHENLEELMDVDQFLQFLAVNAMISNLDGLLGICHNYYLYLPPDGGKAIWIPWDLNLAWGGYQRMGGWDELMELSIRKPWSNQKPLLDKVLAVGQWRAAYDGHLRRLMETSLSAARVQAEIQAMENVVREADRRAGGTITMGDRPDVPWTPSWRKPPSPAVFAAGRWASLRDQLDDRPNGEGYGSYVPRYRMGGLHEGIGFRAAVPLVYTARAFAALDADGNGKLSEAELVAGIVPVLFARADRDGRTAIDQAEVTAAIDELKRQTRQSAGAVDRRRIHRGDQPTTPPGTIMFEADRDLDGRLAKGEVRATMRRLLYEYDLDDDGGLGRQEFANAAERFLAGW